MKERWSVRRRISRHFRAVKPGALTKAGLKKNSLQRHNKKPLHRCNGFNILSVGLTILHQQQELNTHLR